MISEKTTAPSASAKASFCSCLAQCFARVGVAGISCCFSALGDDPISRLEDKAFSDATLKSYCADNIILTVGAKRFRHAEVLFPKSNELLDGNIFTVDAKRFCVQRSFYQVSRGKRWVGGKPKKTAVPHCEERPGATDSRWDQVCVAGFDV